MQNTLTQEKKWGIENRSDANSRPIVTAGTVRQSKSAHHNRQQAEGFKKGQGTRTAKDVIPVAISSI